MPRNNGGPRKSARSKEHRKKLFLKALAETGVVGHAARVASPHAKRPNTTFYDWRREDPEFADQWDEALEEAISSAEVELRRRAVDGWEEPIFSKGELVGTKIVKSDRALELLIKRWRPEYIERRNIELNGGVTVDGQVNHEHQHTHRVAPSIGLDDLEALTPDQRMLFAKMIRAQLPSPEEAASLSDDAVIKLAKAHLKEGRPVGRQGALIEQRS